MNKILNLKKTINLKRRLSISKENSKLQMKASTYKDNSPFKKKILNLKRKFSP